MASDGRRLWNNRMLKMRSGKINKGYLTIIGFGLFVTACNAQNVSWKDMDSAEKAFNERQTKELVAFMSLETMFPDEHVRALAKAAGKGRIKKIDKLVAQGVNVNSRGARNATPLFWAMQNLKGFKKLLELGADPNVVFDDGGNIIVWAVTSKDKRFLELALEYGGNPNLISGQFNETPLFEAAGPHGKSKAVILLDAGANIDAQNLSGDTTLMVAAGLGQFDLVYELLERGADFNIQDERGDKLIDVIVFRQRTMDPKNDLTRWMEKVIEWLNERDVYLPH